MYFPQRKADGHQDKGGREYLELTKREKVRFLHVRKAPNHHANHISNTKH